MSLEHIAPIIKRTQKKFRLTPPKEFVPSEYDEQVRIFDWAHGRPAERIHHNHWIPAIPAECKDPRIKFLFATLNGVPLPIGLAKKMRRAGMRKGIVDIWLPVPQRNPANSLYCPGLVGELKRIKGNYGTTDEQDEWLEALAGWGWDTHVWRGAKEAIESIKEYLGEK